VYFLYLAWLLSESVVTLAVTGNTTFGAIVWSQRRQVFEWHRLTLTGVRFDIRWLSGRGKTLTICVLPAFSVVVTESYCDACLDGENYFQSGCLASGDAGVSKTLTAVDRKSM
jgi:hypothetical protein